MTHAALSYRPEIDGLRAVAVLAVVLYHFGVPGLGGGFVGVDVFFVISGYLIGAILWREASGSGRIALGRFWMRRFRRLAPAWSVMALAVWAVGYAVLLPHDFRELGKSLIAATLFAANIHQYRQAGYFDAAAEEKPLLHMWSLSLEEQFYLVLPLVLLVLARRPRLAVAVLAGLGAASLAASVLGTRSHHVAAFYLFPFRAWELLAGVLLAMHDERARPARLGWPVSALGLGLVLAGVVLIRPGAGFPGWVAAVPVAGTVLLILNGRDENAVNRLLSVRPMVMIGLISYSLYLWHWPVRSLSLFVLGPDLAAPVRAGLIALSFALAWLSWRLVERPARDPRLLPPRALAAGVAVGVGGLLALGAWPFLREGLPQRFGPQVLVHAAAAQDFIQDWSRCTTPSDGPWAGVQTCALGPEGPPRVLAWGDSHLRAIKEGLDQAAQGAGVPVLLIWHAGCPPLFGVDKRETAATRAEDAACSTANRQIAQGIAQTDIPAVLLVGRWSYYATGAGSGVDAENRIALTTQPDALPAAQPAGTRAVPAAEDSKAAGHNAAAAAQGGAASGQVLADPYGAAVARTLTALSAPGRRLFVLRQVPELPRYRSADVARAMARGVPIPPEALSVPRPVAEARDDTGLAPFRAAEAAGQVAILDPWPGLCDDARCLALGIRPDADRPAPVYFDNNHLTNTGARGLSALFAPLWAH